MDLERTDPSDTMVDPGALGRDYYSATDNLERELLTPSTDFLFRLVDDDEPPGKEDLQKALATCYHEIRRRESCLRQAFLQFSQASKDLVRYLFRQVDVLNKDVAKLVETNSLLVGKMRPTASTGNDLEGSDARRPVSVVLWRNQTVSVIEKESIDHLDQGPELVEILSQQVERSFLSTRAFLLPPSSPPRYLDTFLDFLSWFLPIRLLRKRFVSEQLAPAIAQSMTRILQSQMQFALFHTGVFSLAGFGTLVCNGRFAFFVPAEEAWTALDASDAAGESRDLAVHFLVSGKLFHMLGERITQAADAPPRQIG